MKGCMRGARAGALAVFGCCALLASPGAACGANAPAQAAAASSTAPRGRWELLVLPGSWDSLRPGQEEASAWPVLKRAAANPAAVFVAADVESYIWQTQRITLTPAATRRLLAAHAETELEHWWIWHYPFAVRVDGRFLYGGVFDGQMSQMTMAFPVIHAELVDGRAVLHLLPRQESFAFDPRFEETVGQGSGLLAEFVAETSGIAAAMDAEEPDAVRDKFRVVLRDPRIREEFERAGTLVPAPPPPPPEEVVLAANRAVDAAIAARQGERLARLLAADYHLFHPLGNDLGLRRYAPLDKADTLAFYDEGWHPRRYAVLAVEPRVESDKAVVYSLIFLRGAVGGTSGEWALLVQRRFRPVEEGRWQLVYERHRVCFKDWGADAAAEKPLLSGTPMTVVLDGPCWPPPSDASELPVPPPIEAVE